MNELGIINRGIDAYDTLQRTSISEVGPFLNPRTHVPHSTQNLVNMDGWSFPFGKITINEKLNVL